MGDNSRLRTRNSVAKTCRQLYGIFDTSSNGDIIFGRTDYLLSKLSDESSEKDDIDRYVGEICGIGTYAITRWIAKEYIRAKPSYLFIVNLFENDDVRGKSFRDLPDLYKTKFKSLYAKLTLSRVIVED